MKILCKFLLYLILLIGGVSYTQNVEIPDSDELDFIESKIGELEAIKKFKGKELPAFNLKLFEGGHLNSESLIGKPILINFWFTNCAPCLEEIPILNQLKNQFSDKIQFIAITFQDEQEISNFLKNKMEFNFIHLINAKEYIKKFGIFGYPKTLLIDSDGIIKYIEGRIPKSDDINTSKENQKHFVESFKSYLESLF